MNKLQEEKLNKYFEKHCEIVELLLNRSDREHPSVKHHIRAAIREASNHVGNSSGSPKHSAQYMSDAAERVMQSGSVNELIAEHVVPVSELNKIIADIWPVTKEQIAEVLKKNSIRAVITSKEDKRLKDAGLQKRMPPDWDGIDLFARYRAVNILLKDNQYAEWIGSGK